MKAWLWIVFMVNLGLGVAWGEELPSKEAVLSRFIEAVGGHDALEGAEECKYWGVIDQYLSWQDPKQTITPFVAQSNSEGKVWYSENGNWSDLKPAEKYVPRLKLRWLMHPRFALVVEEFFPDLRVNRWEQREGRRFIVLIPAQLNADYYSLYFDAETGLLTYLGIYNELSDWKMAGGVLFPHVFHASRKGGHTIHRFEEARR